MTTLSDQLTVAPDRLFWVASREDILHATAVSVMVGSGTERHGADLTVWAATPARPHPLPGYPDLPAKPAGIGSIRVDCGAQRARSSVRSVSLTAPVTCERCLDVSTGWKLVESLPTDVLTTDRMGRIVPKTEEA